MGLTLSYEANQSGVPFGIFFGVSGNPGRFWDIRNAHRRVGYAGRWSRALCTQYTSTSTAARSADFTTSSNFRSCVSGSLSFAATSGTDSRKPSRKLLFTA